MNLLRCCLLAFVGLLVAGPITQAATPDAGCLPDTTVGYLAVSDLDRFLKAGATTPPGKLLDSKPFQEFFKGVWESQEKDPFTVSWFLGLTLDEARQTGGGLVLAVTGGEQPALVLLLDVAKRPEKVKSLLRQVEERLTRLGADRSQEGNVTVFTLPRQYALGTLSRLAYCVQDGVLAASSHPGVLRDLLAGQANKGQTLADNPAFQTTTGRALKETPGALASWFVEPLAGWTAWRKLSGEKFKNQEMFQAIQKEGFTAIKGAGGAIGIKEQTGELLLRAHVRAPGPYRRAMKMLTFTENANLEPPAWVPQDVAVFGTVSVNAPVSFEAYSYLFDALYGEGEEGVYEEVLKGLKDDPAGPRVDVRKELVARVRGPLLYLERPRNNDSGDNWMMSSAVEQPTAVARAVDRLFKGDKDARRLPFGEHGLWQVLPETPSGNGKSVSRQDKDKAEPDWTLPASAIGVHKGFLLMAGSPELVRQTFQERPPLARDASYQRTTAALDRLAGKSSSLRLFYRLGPLEQQALSELRAGKNRDGNVLARMMRLLLLAGPDRPGGGIDFKKLPTPDKVASLLIGDAGLSGHLTGDTWSFVLILGGK